MPINYLNAKVLSRAKGQSAVAAAAYRSGEVLKSDDRICDYQHKREEDLTHTEIMAPEDAPAWVGDRQQLWLTAERAEKRKDAQLARDIIAALPRELTTEQNIALVRDWVATNFVSKGMVADFAIHESQASDGGKNPHVHLLLTLRPVEGDGFGKKAREWNDPALVTAWRRSFQDITNAHMEAANREERLSMESYATQGIDKQPEEHMGYQIDRLERRNIETNVGNRNRAIRNYNRVKALLDAELAEPHPAEQREASGMLDRLVDSARAAAATSAEMVQRTGRFLAEMWEDLHAPPDRRIDQDREHDHER